MPATRIERIEEGLSALNEGAFDRILDLFAPDAEVQRLGDLGTVRGREAADEAPALAAAGYRASSDVPD
jgi:hypothetical protein